MNYDSNQNQGYEPKMSGGNNAGYYMGESNNLMDMMAYGGSAGGASLAQSLQRVSDADSLEDYQRSEAKRQKGANLLGGIVGFGGSLLGGAFGGSGGAAIGKAFGQGIGEWVGAGKPKSYDTAGTVYGQKDFRDLNKASKEYGKGIGGRALLAGAKTGVSSYLTPGGGIYGTYNPLTKSGWENLGKATSGEIIKKFDPTKKQGLWDWAQPIFGAVDKVAEVAGGGLIGFGNGGYTAEGVLSEAGLDPSKEQLKLFKAYDPTKVEDFQTSLQQNLLSGTKQAQQAQVGMGFSSSGAVQQAQTEQSKTAAKQYGQAGIAAQRGFESDTLQTAADLVAGGSEFKPQTGNITTIDGYQEYIDGGGFVPSGYTGGLPTPGATYISGDYTYVWNGAFWSEEETGE